MLAVEFALELVLEELVLEELARELLAELVTAFEELVVDELLSDAFACELFTTDDEAVVLVGILDAELIFLLDEALGFDAPEPPLPPPPQAASRIEKQIQMKTRRVLLIKITHELNVYCCLCNIP